MSLQSLALMALRRQSKLRCVEASGYDETPKKADVPIRASN